MRTAILVSALAFVALFAGLTLNVLIRNGPDVLTIGSVLVLAMIGTGVVGALRHPPED